MELVGSFDDVDSGISGIRANTRRSGVVVLVDVATLEGAGTLTEIRRIRDRFPFCRFVAYGEAFGEDAASGLLFFGADGVADLADGPVAVAAVIRRSIRPGEYGDPDPEAVEATPSSSDAATREPDPEPEAQPEAPPASDGEEHQEEGLDELGTGSGSPDEIWKVPSSPQVERTRRMTPEDIWDRGQA
jgi:hypothetical protein